MTRSINPKLPWRKVTPPLVGMMVGLRASVPLTADPMTIDAVAAWSPTCNVMSATVPRPDVEANAISYCCVLMASETSETVVAKSTPWSVLKTSPPLDATRASSDPASRPGPVSSAAKTAAPEERTEPRATARVVAPVTVSFVAVMTTMLGCDPGRSSKLCAAWATADHTAASLRASSVAGGAMLSMASTSRSVSVV